MTQLNLSALFQSTDNIPSSFKVGATGVLMRTGDNSWSNIARTPFSVVDVQQLEIGKEATICLECVEISGKTTLVGLDLKHVQDNTSPLAPELARQGIKIQPECEAEVRTFLRESIALASRYDQSPYEYCQPRDMKKVAAMEIPAWEGLQGWFYHYGRPFDEAYVSQPGTKASILKICTGYTVPELAPYVEGYIYCAWRHLFLSGGALLYRCGEDEYRSGALHVACCHDDTCEQVASFTYDYSGPQIGDAIDFRRIQKPVVAKRGQDKLDAIWEILQGDNENPNGQVDYEAMADRFLELLERAIGNGKEPQLTEGIDGFSVKSFVFSGATCTKIDSWDDFEPEEALILVAHAVIWGATAAVEGGRDDK